MTLQPVPAPKSVVRAIEQPLKGIVLKVYDDTPFQVDLRFVEEQLSERERLVDGGTLDPTYDWAGDLRIAKFHHKFALDWLPHHQEVRDRYTRYWRETGEQGMTYVREIALSGMKTILLLHGAVALGALNVLSQSNPSQNLVGTAKFAIAFSLIGIFMLGAGQVMLISLIGITYGKVLGKLSNKIRWSKVRAFGRYTLRTFRILKFADWLIYGSVFWFSTYTVILYILIVS